jgi:hypothetical protein
MAACLRRREPGFRDQVAGHEVRPITVIPEDDATLDPRTVTRWSVSGASKRA